MFPSNSLVQTRSTLPATNTPRVNIVAVLTFLTPVVLGALAFWFTSSPI